MAEKDDPWTCPELSATEIDVSASNTEAISGLVRESADKSILRHTTKLILYNKLSTTLLSYLQIKTQPLQNSFYISYMLVQ